MSPGVPAAFDGRTRGTLVRGVGDRPGQGRDAGAGARHVPGRDRAPADQPRSPRAGAPAGGRRAARRAGAGRERPAEILQRRGRHRRRHPGRRADEDPRTGAGRRRDAAARRGRMAGRNARRRACLDRAGVACRLYARRGTPGDPGGPRNRDPVPGHAVAARPRHRQRDCRADRRTRRPRLRCALRAQHQAAEVQRLRRLVPGRSRQRGGGRDPAPATGPAPRADDPRAAPPLGKPVLAAARLVLADRQEFPHRRRAGEQIRGPRACAGQRAPAHHRGRLEIDLAERAAQYPAGPVRRPHLVRRPERLSRARPDLRPEHGDPRAFDQCGQARQPVAGVGPRRPDVVGGAHPAGTHPDARLEGKPGTRAQEAKAAGLRLAPDQHGDRAPAQRPGGAELRPGGAADAGWWFRSPTSGGRAGSCARCPICRRRRPACQPTISSDRAGFNAALRQG